MVAKENALRVPGHHQLRREGSVKGSKGLMILLGKEGVKPAPNSGRGSGEGSVASVSFSVPRAHLV